MASLRALPIRGPGESSTRVLGRGFCPLNSWKGWAELFSLPHQRMEGDGEGWG